MKLTGQDVIKAWDNADAEDIHPLRAKADLEEYWASGVAQAFQAAKWAGEGPIIDYGCGEGRIAIPLALMGYNVIAADTSPAMLQRLREAASGWRETYGHLLPDTGGKPGSMTLWTVKEGLDLPRASLIVCRAVLIHQSHADGARLVGEMAAALEPGGHLVADWPTGDHYERRHWIDVTRWDSRRRAAVAEEHGLTLVQAEDGPSAPSVWQKI